MHVCRTKFQSCASQQKHHWPISPPDSVQVVSRILKNWCLNIKLLTSFWAFLQREISSFSDLVIFSRSRHFGFCRVIIIFFLFLFQPKSTQPWNLQLRVSIEPQGVVQLWSNHGMGLQMSQLGRRLSAFCRSFFPSPTCLPRCLHTHQTVAGSIAWNPLVWQRI